MKYQEVGNLVPIREVGDGKGRCRRWSKYSLCTKSHLLHWFSMRRANRTQKWFVFYGFLGPIHVWDFLVSVIVISWDSWLHHRSLHLCCTVVLLGPNPVGDCASNRAVSYQSVEGIYTFENDFGCVLQKGSDSPEPCLRTSLPEEKTQVGGTHVSFVYQSARPQIRLVLTWRNKFPFHSTT